MEPPGPPGRGSVVGLVAGRGSVVVALVVAVVVAAVVVVVSVGDGGVRFVLSNSHCVFESCRESFSSDLFFLLFPDTLAAGCA